MHPVRELCTTEFSRVESWEQTIFLIEDMSDQQQQQQQPLMTTINRNNNSNNNNFLNIHNINTRDRQNSIVRIIQKMPIPPHKNHHNQKSQITHDISSIYNTNTNDNRYMCDLDPMLQFWCWESGGSTIEAELYRASVHGFSASQFHFRCDNQGPTLTLITTTDGRRFGGFTTQSWSSSSSSSHSNDNNNNNNNEEDEDNNTPRRRNKGVYKTDTHAWLFSLDSQMKIPVTQPECAIFASPSRGPTFGGGHDLCIHDSSDMNTYSYFNIGESYGSDATMGNKEFFAAGSHRFMVSEITVYKMKSTLY